MIDILIVEDERAAAKSLIGALTRVWSEENYTVVSTLETIRETVAFLQDEEEPDLIFMDIQLADGLSFEIFKQHSPSCPIIFVTAYDDYAIKAFKVNGLHYLLKPISDSDLLEALERFKSTSRQIEPSLGSLKELLNQVQERSYKERFLVQSKGSMVTIKSADIEIIHLTESGLWLCTTRNEKFKLSTTLDSIEVQLNPRKFYRASRQALIAKESIRKIDPYFNQRWIISMKSFSDEHIIVSKSKATEFKQWLEQ